MLSIVSTPIGNLKDITLRALEVLQSCDVIVCEDTRVTGNLIKQLELPKKELMSFHSHSNDRKINAVLERLRNDEHVVLVSDAGTPGISDPGYGIVSRVCEEGLDYEVIPGPSAFLTALSGTGFPIHQFVYLGFLPLKKGRQTLLESLHDEKRTVVFYESVHRIKKTLQQLADALTDQPERRVCIARELTKMHEEFVHTSIGELPDTIASLTEKGEFVVTIAPQ